MVLLQNMLLKFVRQPFVMPVLVESFSFFTQNSERRKWNTERMNKIAISAMKQSGRYWLTKIHAPINFEDFIAIDHPKNKLIAHCRSSLKQPLHNLTSSSKPQLIVIGPEGDFTENEINNDTASTCAMWQRAP